MCRLKSGGAIFATAILLIVGTPGQAAKAPPAVFRDLLACRGIAAADQRLACFDAKAADIEGAAKRGDVLVADRKQVEESERALFGFGRVRIPLLDDKANADMTKQVSLKITGQRNLGYGKAEYRFEDGSLWRQLDPSDGFPSVGKTATIKAGALNSYMMKIGNEHAVRVLRVE